MNISLSRLFEDLDELDELVPQIRSCSFLAPDGDPRLQRKVGLKAKGPRGGLTGFPDDEHFRRHQKERCRSHQRLYYFIPNLRSQSDC
jgi:hypothetical protein